MDYLAGHLGWELLVRMAFGFVAAVAGITLWAHSREPSLILVITAVLLGYVNSADLGSENHNALYTPNALFVATLSFSIDALYLRMQGQPASEPTFLAKSQQRATF